MLDAEGDEVAFESPTVDLPFADGFELELASPPVVEPSVFDVALALEPPDELLLEELDAELDDELALPPVVEPLVVDEALEPEPLTVAAPVELGDASALEAPVVAALLLLTVTAMLPPLAFTVFVVDGVWVAVEPPCEPLPLCVELPLPEPPPLCVGDTVEVLLPPLAVPDAVGELLMLTLPPVIVLVDDGDEVAVELPTLDVPVACGDEVEVEEPPVAVPVVEEFELALPPDPLLVAVAPAPPVVPLVAVCAADPEPPTVPVASANAGETPATTRPATATPASADALAPLRMVRRSNASRLKYCMRIASMKTLGCGQFPQRRRYGGAIALGAPEYGDWNTN